MRILFTGGGTGGHIFPIIAVARQLKKIFDVQRVSREEFRVNSRDSSSWQARPQNDRDCLEMYFLGVNGFGKELLIKEGIKTRIILTGKLRRYFSLHTLIDILKMPMGFLQSFWHLYIWMPDVIFSKGGYGGLPVILIGWLFRIPILIHESDTIPGLVNRLTAKFAKRIAFSFDLSKKYFPDDKIALLGNPVRSEITKICSSQDSTIKEKAKKEFKIKSQKPIILVLGGSQGARKLNELVEQVLTRLLEKYEIIHQAGKKNKILSKGIPQDLSYHAFPFLSEGQIAQAYVLADLVISRAGAGSIFEISACAKPSILIPLPDSASNHQRQNAFAYARAGATVVLEQDNLTPNLFLNEISKILDNPELIQKMKQSAQNFSRPEASQKIAQALIEMGE